MSMRARVDGEDRLARKLAAMPVRAKVLIRQALDKGADDVVQAQKALAATSRRTGALIESIQSREGRHELAVEVYSDAFYSRFVEFGTVDTPAQPFFFPGYRLQRKRVRSRIARATSKAVKEVSRGG